MRTSTALVLLLAIASCTSQGTPQPDSSSGAPGVRASGPPDAPPSIRGTLTSITQGDSLRAPAPSVNPDQPVSCPPDCDQPGRPMRAILIEERPGMEAGGDKSHVTVPAGVRIWRRTGTGFTEARFADLKLGQTVSAWFSGPVAESYPTQATAGALSIDAPPRP